MDKKKNKQVEQIIDQIDELVMKIEKNIIKVKKIIKQETKK